VKAVTRSLRGVELRRSLRATRAIDEPATLKVGSATGTARACERYGSAFLAGEIAMAIRRKCLALLGAMAVLALGACADDPVRLSAASGGAMGGSAPQDVVRAAHDSRAIEFKRAFAF
jgi:hypothetical protein